MSPGALALRNPATGIAGCCEQPRRRHAAECGQQFPSSDGDCHTPLPCEVRTGTIPRHERAVFTAGKAQNGLRSRPRCGRFLLIAQNFRGGAWPNVRSWGEPDTLGCGNDANKPQRSSAGSKSQHLSLLPW